MVNQISLTIIFWRPNCPKNASDAAILTPIKENFPSEFIDHPNTSTWEFQIGKIDYQNYQKFEEPSQKFYEDSYILMLKSTEYISSLSDALIKSIESAGLQKLLIVELNMDEDDMFLDLPPILIAELNRCGIGVHVISNP